MTNHLILDTKTIYLMGAATLQEGRSLMQWLRREGYGRLSVCGISMGGHMAAQVGALFPAIIKAFGQL